jgi:cytochrome c peroxidase
MLRLRRFVLFVLVLFASTLVSQQWLTTSSANKNSSTTNNLVEGAGLPAPTGLSASDGDYPDKVGVLWNTVRGAALYRIFRNTDSEPSSAVEVGTTAANYFFDTTALPSQNYFYWVRAENNGSNSSLSNGDNGLRSVGSFTSEIFSPLAPPPSPAGNSVTAAKDYLGKVLFWDEQLSSTLTVACGTCHRSSHGGSDPRTNANNSRSRHPGFDTVFGTADDVFGSPGVPLNNLDGTYSQSNLFGLDAQVTARKAPSYLNAGLASNGLFWDGRASSTFRDPLTGSILLTEWASYESQVLGPPVSATEMAHGGRDWTQVANQISSAKPLALASNIPTSLAAWIDGRTYPELFADAFGSPEVTPSRIAMAIATHERTLFSDRAPLDRFASAIEPLTAAENRGAEIYVESDCNFCHGGPLLSDQNFHNIGVRPQIEDLGRAFVTGNLSDWAKFKTPTLRNVELRAAYMHNGRFATLEEVVEFYDRGGDFDAPNKDPRVRPLNLTTQEKADLVAFLKRPMTDPRVRDELPPFDRPQLYSESSRVPVITGIGRAGSGGFIPQAIAIEPPIVGNPSFTVAVSSALGGAQAVLVIDSNDPGVGSSIPSSGSLLRVQVNIDGSGNGNGFGSFSLPIPNNPALIGQTFYGRWYIPDVGAANGFSVSQAFRFTVFGEASNNMNKAAADFDGDGKTDVSVFRSAAGYWYISQSSNNAFRAEAFGIASDRITPGDYDGDGKCDIAVWRPSTGYWYRLDSSTGTFRASVFGQNEDIPTPADFDGDGKTDLAVYRPSNNYFYHLNSTDGSFHFKQWGASGDVPVMGDYDGDGKNDYSIYRGTSSTFYYLRSSDGEVRASQWGASGDKPIAGDFDGDGTTDIAVYRPSTGGWYAIRSSDSAFFGLGWGTTGDIPAAGDYDGDAKTDVAVFRPSAGLFYILQSATSSLRAEQFGTSGDLPVVSAFVP